MLKKYFSAGLLLWIPLVVTFWVLETVVRWSDSVLVLLPENLRPEALLGIHIPGIGLVIAAAIVLVTGILVANILGQWVIRLWEGFLRRIPVVRPLYSGAKQITSTLLSNQTESFRDVVLVEFPQAGQWTYGFIVSTPPQEVCGLVQTPDLVSVYIPTAPNPTSGYVIMASRARLRATTVSIDEAFKFHISLGVMQPQARPGAPAEEPPGR